jgi:hypothetical protein
MFSETSLDPGRPKFSRGFHDNTHPSGSSELRIPASLNVPHRRNADVNSELCLSVTALERGPNHCNQLRLSKRQRIGLHTAQASQEGLGTFWVQNSGKISYPPQLTDS